MTCTWCTLTPSLRKLLIIYLMLLFTDKKMPLQVSILSLYYQYCPFTINIVPQYCPFTINTVPLLSILSLYYQYCPSIAVFVGVDYRVCGNQPHTGLRITSLQAHQKHEPGSKEGTLSLIVGVVNPTPLQPQHYEYETEGVLTAGNTTRRVRTKIQTLKSTIMYLVAWYVYIV